MLISEEFRIWN